MESNKFLTKNGVFKVVVQGSELEVMFHTDYRQLHHKSEYDFRKNDKDRYENRLHFAGRKKSSSVVLLNCKDFERLSTEMLTDQNGYFNVVIDGKVHKAIMVSDYAKLNKVNRETVRLRAKDKSYPFDKYLIKRATSEKPISLIVYRAEVESSNS